MRQPVQHGGRRRFTSQLQDGLHLALVYISSQMGHAASQAHTMPACASSKCCSQSRPLE
jgi:hypothetical protein